MGDPKIREHRLNYRRNVYHTVQDELAFHSPDWNLKGTLQIVDWAGALITVLGEQSEAPEFLPSSAFRR